MSKESIPENENRTPYNNLGIEELDDSEIDFNSPEQTFESDEEGEQHGFSYSITNPVEFTDSIISEAESMEAATLDPLAPLAEPDRDTSVINAVNSPTYNTLNAEVIQKLRLAFSLGWQNKDACRFAGISEAHFYKLLQFKPILKKYIETWRLIPRKKAMLALMQSLDSTDERLRNATARFIIEKTDPSYLKPTAQSPSSAQLSHSKSQNNNNIPLPLDQIKQMANFIKIDLNFSNPPKNDLNTPKIDSD